MDQVKKLIFKKKSDLRGTLIPIEAYQDVPFSIERIFFIKNMDSFPRGFHSHRKTLQVLIPLQGSFELELTDGQTTSEYLLDEDNQGLLIPINIWLVMKNYSPDCLILVICSYPYDEKEYVRNFGDFIKIYHQLEKDKQVIPCFSLQQQTQNLEAELKQRIHQVIQRNEFVLGTEVQTFENDFAKYLKIVN